LTTRPFSGIYTSMFKELTDRAAKNIRAILEHAIQYQAPARAVVIFDTETPLARLVTEAYRIAMPDASFVEFSQTTPDEILKIIYSLQPRDLVLLVQSSNFRLNEFRIRIELFKRSLKTIEHTHLERMTEEQFPVYIDSLAYDPSYYRPLGKALKEKLAHAKDIVVECAGTRLVYEGGMEEAKLNIGDYAEMKNVGGTFPIGEVFTEPKDLQRVNGEAMVFAFAANDHQVKRYEPFKVTIRDGILSMPDGGPKEFEEILTMIRADEPVLVREFGLGLNPAMGKERMLNDITAFERMKGLHLSLGGKHAIYAKPGLGRKQGRYHVDIFVDVERILINNEIMFENGEYASRIVVRVT
jgi:aminopeptidase